MQLIRCALILCLLWWVSLAQATDDRVVRSAFWVDNTASASIDEVIQQSAQGAFQSFGGTLAEGYIPHPVWIALTLAAGDPEAEHWVIRIRPPWHDRIELYDPTTSLAPIMAVGSQIDRPVVDYESLTLDFVLPQPAHEHTVYLKIQTVHSLLLHLDVLEISTARRLDQQRALFFGFYFSFLLAVLFWSLITWIGDRERVLGAFCLQLIFSIAYAAFMFGLARTVFSGVLSTLQIDALTNLLIIAYPASVIWFYRELFTDYGLKRWPRRALDLLVAVGAACLIIVLIGHTQMALKINAMTISLAGLPLLMSPWLFIDSSQSRSDDHVPLWVMRWVVSGVLLLAFLGVTRTLGVGGESGVIINGFLLHGFLLSVLMSITLQYRSKQRSRSLIASESRAMQRALDEQNMRERLQQFMQMFSHEVRTPLSVASIAIEQGIDNPQLAAQGAQAVSDINALVSRCLQVDQIENKSLGLSIDRFVLRPVLDDAIASLGVQSRLEWRGDAEWVVSADAWACATIFSNLIENAVKYGLPQQAITVSFAALDEGMLMVRVTNAIDEHGGFDALKVFDKFYRSQQAKRKSGAGLGLYLSCHLAAQQGGSLSARIEQDQLAVFEWTIRR